MKKIVYQYCIDVNHGTDENPQIVQKFYTKVMESPIEMFEANLALVQKEAYNGEYTVEDIEDPIVEPTAEERIAELEKQVAQADEIAISLYEAQIVQEEINKNQDEIIAVQDETLIQLYEMIGGQ